MRILLREEVGGSAFLFEEGFKYGGAALLQDLEADEDAPLRLRVTITPIGAVSQAVASYHAPSPCTISAVLGALEVEWGGGGLRMTPGDPQLQVDLMAALPKKRNLLLTVSISRSPSGYLVVSIEELR